MCRNWGRQVHEFAYPVFNFFYILEFLKLSSFQPSVYRPKRISRNSRSAAMESVWIDIHKQTSISDITARNRVCVEFSMGREYPLRVRANNETKDERTITCQWHVSDWKVKASLQLEAGFIHRFTYFWLSRESRNSFEHNRSFPCLQVVPNSTRRKWGHNFWSSKKRKDESRF